MSDMRAIMQKSPVIPVVTVDDVDTAVANAKDLYAGGLAVIEVVWRTAAALESLPAIKAAVPELCVGMGTVWTQAQAREAIAAGAEFIVSPGIADAVGAVCRELGVPHLPAAQTVSELAHLVGQGYTASKLFPADVLGGPKAIKAFSAVLPQLLFCPTGGIAEQTASDYLALPSVACVGGSWLTRGAATNADGTSSVRAAAQRAAALTGA